MMRTTLNLPDDVYQVARSLAAAKNVSLGDAIAELVRKGLRPDLRVREDTGFPCFAVPEGAPPITLEQTLAAEDEV
jgi:hypothetical protein